jgi:hypothetical protein
MKSQSIANLPIESARIYWILDLQGDVHSIWDLWPSGLQECKGNIFFEVGQGVQHVSVGFKKFFEGLSNPDLTPQKLLRGCLMSTQVNFLKITKLIMMVGNPLCTHLLSYEALLFMSNSLHIIAFIILD